MKSTYTRVMLQTGLLETYASTDKLKAALKDPSLPADLQTWLSKLALLYGVPFNYLVPDEQMLPQESIRFFNLDKNWINAIIDGAMSIGRNLSSDQSLPKINLERAVSTTVMKQINGSITHIREKALGLKERAPVATTISGFLLRSSVITDYLGIGVNAYPAGHTPDDPEPQMLDILRLEQLAPNSDTMICLLSGDAFRIDIHEPSQSLHYGVSCFKDSCTINKPLPVKPVDAVKSLYTFGVTTAENKGITTNSVTMSSVVTPIDISSAFRPNSRVIEFSALADLILQTNKTVTPPSGTTPPTSIDAAIMGFEMTEGVGMVSYLKST